MNTNLFSKISIAISLVLLIAYIFLRLQLQFEENEASGKLLALSSIKYLVVLYATYVPLIIFGISISLSVLGSKRKEEPHLVVFSFLTAFLVIFIYYWPFLKEII